MPVKLNPAKALRLKDLDATPATLWRFAAFVEVTPGPLDTPCHVWQGWRDDKGYGRFKTVVDGEHKSVWAHRWRAAVAYGGLRHRQVVDHLCHNPSCVNPEHLRPSTVAQNNKTRRPFPRRRAHDVHAAVA